MHPGPFFINLTGAQTDNGIVKCQSQSVKFMATVWTGYLYNAILWQTLDFSKRTLYRQIIKYKWVTLSDYRRLCLWKSKYKPHRVTPPPYFYLFIYLKFWN